MCPGSVPVQCIMYVSVTSDIASNDESSQTKRSTSYSVNTTAVVVGSALGAVIVILTIVIVVLLTQRR